MKTWTGLWDRDVAPMADCLPSMAQAQSPVMALPKRKKKKKKSSNHHMTLWPIFQKDLSRNLRGLVHHALSCHRALLRPFPQSRVWSRFSHPLVSFYSFFRSHLTFHFLYETFSVPKIGATLTLVSCAHHASSAHHGI